MLACFFSFVITWQERWARSFVETRLRNGFTTINIQITETHPFLLPGFLSVPLFDINRSRYPGTSQSPDNLLTNNSHSLVVTFATAGRLPVFAQDVTTSASAGRREGFRARDS